MTIALTTMTAASLAILVYIAVVITGTYTTQNISPSTNTSLAEQAKLDSAMSQQIARSLDYVQISILHR
jgi:ABC-type maltose transport system permease subunit